jgi:hypothetical protein
MPIQYQFERGLACPVIICDVCNERITNYAEAHVLTRDLTEETEDERPIYVHWRECEHTVHEEYPNHERLDVFLLNLCSNGIDWPEAFRVKDLFDDLTSLTKGEE